MRTLCAVLVAAALLACDKPGDSDGDGVTDKADNCTVVANAKQLDADGDGFGNACDGDYDQDGGASGLDRSFLLRCLNLPALDDCAVADHDEDGGFVDSHDVVLFDDTLLGNPPGPSCCAR